MNNDILKPLFAIIVVIAALAVVMIPFIMELSDDVAMVNSNPVGTYMLRDGEESTVKIEITDEGILVNNWNVGTSYRVIIAEDVMLTTYNGSVAIFDRQNNVYSTNNTIGYTLEMKAGSCSYTQGETTYTFTYDEVLYPSKKGNYSAYGNGTAVNVTKGMPAYYVSISASTLPKFVLEYDGPTKTNLVNPFTVSGNSLVNFTDLVTLTVPATESEDGKSWQFTTPRSAVVGETSLTATLIAPNTYETVGSYGMLITIFQLSPVLIGFMLFAGIAIHMSRMTKT